MELVRPSGLRGGVDLTRQQPGEALAGRGEAVALEPTVDGTRAGQRADVRALQLGQDGGGADRAVAGRRLGMGWGRSLADLVVTLQELIDLGVGVSCR